MATLDLLMQQHIDLPSDTHLAYVLSHEAWYADVHRAEGTKTGRHVVVSASDGGGGWAWEFLVVEHRHNDPFLRVCMFDDSWTAYAQIPAFFAALAAGEVSTLDDVRTLLDRMGAVDETVRVDPDE